MKQLRKRLTYANVMSSIAVFLVLGGGAAIAAGLAKNSVGPKQLKKNAVTSAKIKNNAVTAAKIKNGAITGAKVNAASLGTVPNATHAVTADNAGTAGTAGTAGNANTVGGLHVVKFSLNGVGNLGKAEILNLNGLQIHASCNSGGITLTATTSVADGEISAWAEDASESYEYGEGEYSDEFDPGDNIELPMPTESDVIGDGAYTGGDLRTVRFFYNQEDDAGSNDCLLNGYAIG